MTSRQRVILCVLSDGAERFGLDIVADSHGAVGRAVLHVIMGRLEDLGWVVGREVAYSDGHPRRAYLITPAGAAQLLPRAEVTP